MQIWTLSKSAEQGAEQGTEQDIEQGAELSIDFFLANSKNLIITRSCVNVSKLIYLHIILFIYNSFLMIVI